MEGNMISYRFHKVHAQITLNQKQNEKGLQAFIKPTLCGPMDINISTVSIENTTGNFQCPLTYAENTILKYNSSNTFE